MSSDPPSLSPGASTSSSSIQKSFTYDVFISFRGVDTRNTFVGHLYEALKQKGIKTFKDDKEMKQGKTITIQLVQAIRDSRFFIIVFSQKYASSSWCLGELVEIMECHKTGKQTARSVFLDVKPANVRDQSGTFGESFLENKVKDDARKWIEALIGATTLCGRDLDDITNGHEAELIKIIVRDILVDLRSINLGWDKTLVGMKTRVKDVISYLEVCADEVRMIGIKGIAGGGKTTTARAVFYYLSESNDFEGESLVENVRGVSESVYGLKKLQEQVLSNVLNECNPMVVNGVFDGTGMLTWRMRNKKVLLLLDDVDHVEQLRALAGEPEWFKQGSIILITTRDEQVLAAHGVKVICEINLLSDDEATCLFNRCVLGRESPLQGYEELSLKFVRYAAGLPFIMKVLGDRLIGSDKDALEDAIERVKEIPYKETLKRLEDIYSSLEEDDFQKIFLDIACILKGQTKEDAIRILDCCGLHPITGLRVLEQRSLITISKDGYLSMNDRIVELGKIIVRREHPDEPNKHSRLWIDEEIEDILANDMGTEETRCLKLNIRKGDLRILMKGLGKMKKLRYLEMEINVRYSDSRLLDESTQYFPNSLNYLECWNYPFLYLPTTFQATNLVGLDMKYSKMVQLWEKGNEKVLKKLKFLSLSNAVSLKTFDFRFTPNLEKLFLYGSSNLVELYMPARCQKLNCLRISHSKLRTFNLDLTPNLETLYLVDCVYFEVLHVSVKCPNLKFLNVGKSRLRRLNRKLFPNLKSIDHAGCDELEINGI